MPSSRTGTSHANLSQWCGTGSSAQCWTRPLWRGKHYKNRDTEELLCLLCWGTSSLGALSLLGTAIASEFNGSSRDRRSGENWPRKCHAQPWDPASLEDEPWGNHHARQKEIIILHPCLHCNITARPENHKALILEGLRRHTPPFTHPSPLNPFAPCQGQAPEPPFHFP